MENNLSLYDMKKKESNNFLIEKLELHHIFFLLFSDLTVGTYFLYVKKMNDDISYIYNNNND